jgi:DNA ligase-1
VLLCNSLEEEKWKKAVFWVFDTPSNEKFEVMFLQIRFSDFETRMEFLNNLKLPDFVRIVDRVKCKGKEHLEEYFLEITEKGGEGVILRGPQSLYKAGKSESLCKFKPFFDTEVKVLENNFPHGFQCKQ